MTTLFRIQGWSSLFAAAVLLVLASSQYLGRLLGAAQPSAALYFFVALGSAVLAFLLARIFARRRALAFFPNESVYPREFLAGRPAWIVYVQIALSIFILLQAVWGAFSQPFNFDEQNIIYGLIQRPIHRLNPFIPESHAFASLCSFLSTKIFGLSKFALRIPSLGFTFLFLVILNIFCAQYVSVMGTLFVFSHLAVNQMFLWYTHSMRGYIAMMLIATVTFKWACDFTRGQISNWGIAGLLLLFPLSATVHGFAAIYSLVVFGSLVAWISIHLNTLQKKHLEQGCRILVGSFVVLPATLLILKVQRDVLAHAQNGYLDPTQASGTFASFWLPIAARLFGFDSVYALAPFAAIALLIVGALILHRSKLRFGFRSVFVASYAVFFLLLVKVTHCRYLEPRFFLGLLPLGVVVLAEVTNLVEWGWKRVAVTALVFVALVGAPLVVHSDLKATLTDGNTAYDTFMRTVPRKISRTERTCFTLSGDPQKVYLAENLYLRKLLKANDPAKCETRYHLSIGEEAPKFSTSDRGAASATALYDDHAGNRLYELKGTAAKPVQVTAR